MRYCTACAKKYYGGEHFCPVCGSPLEETAPQTTADSLKSTAALAVHCLKQDASRLKKDLESELSEEKIQQAKDELSEMADKFKELDNKISQKLNSGHFFSDLFKK